MTKQFSVTAPDGLYAAVQAVAERDRRSVSQTVVMLLEGALAEPAGAEMKGLGRATEGVDRPTGTPRGTKTSGIGSGSVAGSASASFKPDFKK